MPGQLPCSRVRRIHDHVVRCSPAAAEKPRRPLGILGADESAPGALFAEQLQAAFHPAPAEVRTVGSQSTFSADEYRDQGFTGPVQLFSADQASAVAAAFLGASQVTNKQALSSGSEQPSQKPPSTHPATWADTLQMAQDSSLLDLASNVLGPDVVLWATVFWHKAPGSEGYIPWHQDGVYWPLSPRVNFTAWVALTPITAASGRLCVLPGSHTAWRDDDYAPLAPPAAFGEALPPDVVDTGKRVEFELQPGEVVFFDEAVVHASPPNTSSGDRLALALRMTTPAVQFDQAECEARMPGLIKTLLLRGEDRHHLNDDMVWRG